MQDDAITQAKQAVRERVWALLEREGVVAPGVLGKIPDFVGKEAAADRLAELEVWKRARVVMVNPDRAQLPVRVRALQDGKLLYMAVPNLIRNKPFYLLDPGQLDDIDLAEAATGSGVAKVAPLIGPDEMKNVDLVVFGSVVVSPLGVRIGKGAGYTDTEIAILANARLIETNTTTATTVHQSQILTEDLPETPLDVRVHYIVTPEETIHSCQH